MAIYFTTAAVAACLVFLLAVHHFKVVRPAREVSRHIAVLETRLNALNKRLSE